MLQGSLGGSSRTAVIVNLIPGTDDTGEVLSALRFAARASKIKVVAKVGRYVDYEQLYKDARRRIEQIEGGSSLSETLTEKLMIKDQLIEQKQLEIDQLKESLSLLRSSISNSTENEIKSGKLLSTASSMPDDSKSCTMDEEVAAAHRHWQTKLNALTEEHLAVMDASNKANNERLRRANLRAENLNSEISSLQHELSAERQSHLSTVQSLRQAHEKALLRENELQGRINDLLVELSDRRSVMEDLKEAAAASAAGATAEAEVKYRDYVSREQVKEMENLFIETVTRLTDRVRVLEDTKGKSAPGNANGSGIKSTQQQQQQQGNRNIRIEPGGKIRPSLWLAHAGANGTVVSSTTPRNEVQQQPLLAAVGTAAVRSSSPNSKHAYSSSHSGKYAGDMAAYNGSGVTASNGSSQMGGQAQNNASHKAHSNIISDDLSI